MNESPELASRKAAANVLLWIIAAYGAYLEADRLADIANYDRYGRAAAVVLVDRLDVNAELVRRSCAGAEAHL